MLPLYALSMATKSMVMRRESVKKRNQIYEHFKVGEEAIQACLSCLGSDPVS
jgi:hypothetical protein